MTEKKADAGAGVQVASNYDDNIAVAITSASALATAWAAFQSRTWSGQQTFELARAAALRQKATQAQLEGDQIMHLDVDLFIAFTSAQTDHRDDFAAFLRGRFPPRLRKAMDTWLATDPMKSAAAAPHPFALPEYQVDRFAQAQALNTQVDRALQEGAESNRISETYTLGTVVLSVVILFASLGSHLRTRGARRVSMVVSSGLLLIAIVWLVRSPLSWIGND
jgi:hypothetical protein